MQVVAHERPRRLAHAEHELVEEFDEQQHKCEKEETAARADARARRTDRLLCGRHEGDSPYPRKPWTFSLKVCAKTSSRGGGITERASANHRRRGTRTH